MSASVNAAGNILRCEAPTFALATDAAEAQEYALQVSLNGHDFQTALGQAAVVYPAPVFTSVSPGSADHTSTTRVALSADSLSWAASACEASQCK